MSPMSRSLNIGETGYDTQDMTGWDYKTFICFDENSKMSTLC